MEDLQEGLRKEDPKARTPKGPRRDGVGGALSSENFNSVLFPTQRQPLSPRQSLCEFCLGSCCLPRWDGRTTQAGMSTPTRGVGRGGEEAWTAKGRRQRRGLGARALGLAVCP